MAYDLDALTRTLDMRQVDPTRARVVNALRYCHVAKTADNFCPNTLGYYLGSRLAVSSFHVFLDEAGRAWPEPISLNQPCNPHFSYDEMLLADLCSVAADNDRRAFDDMTRDMLGQGARNAIWSSARRLMQSMASVTD
ncbi:MAG: hypothetical protein AAGH57_12175 [Pseudomonadota bacterium]